MSWRAVVIIGAFILMSILVGVLTASLLTFIDWAVQEKLRYGFVMAALGFLAGVVFTKGLHEECNPQERKV